MGGIVYYFRKSVLFVFQRFWAIHQFGRKVIVHWTWWIKCAVFGWTPINLSKAPKVPAIISSKIDDLARFATWGLQNRSDTIIMYDPTAKTTIDMLVERLRTSKQVDTHQVMLESAKARACISLKESRQVTLRLIQGREQYVDALSSKLVEQSTPTAELPSILDTPKVDMLVLCGIESLGNFPPFALRACEIYFTSSPMSYHEYCRILHTFARSEQRLGT